MRGIGRGHRRRHIGRQTHGQISPACVVSVRGANVRIRAACIRVGVRGCRIRGRRVHALCIRIRARVRRYIDPVRNHQVGQVCFERIDGGPIVVYPEIPRADRVRDTGSAIPCQHRVGRVGRGGLGRVSRCVPRDLDSRVVAPDERQAQAHRCRHDQLARGPLEEALDALPDLVFLHGSGTLYACLAEGGSPFTAAGARRGQLN